MLQLGQICANNGAGDYVVYMITCRDGCIYTGCTNDLKKRLAKHNAGTAACFTRPAKRRPVTLLAVTTAMDKGSALRVEYRIKSLSRRDKLVVARLIVEANKGAPNGHV